MKKEEKSSKYEKERKTSKKNTKEKLN